MKLYPQTEKILNNLILKLETQKDLTLNIIKNNLNSPNVDIDKIEQELENYSKCIIKMDALFFILEDEEDIKPNNTNEPVKYNLSTQEFEE